ncbi:uncharacterized protein LOC114339248 [Diabrotica virgifera virgifera]|uniref:Uncharacterized protein n=1 Tax=Diabrotica virgifera virgifera TaxID=50390 RepID=A0ABM5IWP6_DIAVI|nr:uncharacterized protein LOC114339248 [Diabrotica virgifera virgifera]
MELITVSLFLIYFTTSVSGIEVHTPEVKEKGSEINSVDREGLRLTRKSEDTYPSVAYVPHKFNFQLARQQDYLKQRYAQQQLIDVEKIAAIHRNPSKKNKNIEILKQAHLDSTEPHTAYEWQPTDSSSRSRHQRSSDNSKTLDYIPIRIKTARNSDDKAKNKKEESESPIRRKDENEPGFGGQIIYLDPRILKQLLDLKNKRTQIQSRSFDEHSGAVDTNSLNELIGKNPHVQLESLKRLLHQSHQTKFVPVISQAHAFHQKDHTPITEKTIDVPNPQSKPNIKVEHEDSSNDPQTQQIVTKETFEKIQQQLDEASKFQVQQALEQAHQAAQAHVAAQHKAIEQAQRAIFEKVQKSLYDSPQALRLVRPEESDVTTHINVPVQHQQVIYSTPGPVQTIKHQADFTNHLNTPPQQHQSVYSTPLPPIVVSPVHDIQIPTSKVHITKYNTALTTAGPTVLHNTIESTKKLHQIVQNENHQEPVLHNVRIIQVTPIPTHGPKHILMQPQVKHLVLTQKQAPQYQTKSIEHYAPNHLHQTAAQLQAEKVLLQQVQSHNNAILNSNKGVNRYVGQKVQAHAFEAETAEKEAQPSANAYQHIYLDHKEADKFNSVDPQLEHKEENEELQYAAKYAFGYRIKDNKEGNDFGHEEKRSGRSAEGSYHVLLPDGRMQKVEYYADDNGYHAKVTYENVAEHK